MIYCIMFAGPSLSVIAADVLFKTAQVMVAKDKTRFTVTHDDCSGYVETDYEGFSLNGINGCRFTAQVMTPKGETKVEFLVRMTDLELVKQVKWTDHRSKKKKRRSKDAHHWN